MAAKAEVRRALELDPDLAEAHYASGVVKLFLEWEWAGAEADIRKALELNPAYGRAYAGLSELMVSTGRAEEALSLLRRARQLDPSSRVLDGERVFLPWLAGRGQDSLAAAADITAAGRDSSGIREQIAMTTVDLGRYSEGIALLQSRMASPDVDRPSMMAYLARAYDLNGQRTEAQAVIADLLALSKQTYVSPVHLAVAYMGVGARDEAFDWLERAHKERSGFLIYIKAWPAFVPLHSDPRFADLVRRMGLPP